MPPDVFLSVAQFAERWNCSRDHILAVISRGDVRAIDISLRGRGRHRPTWRIPLAEIEALELRRTRGPAPHADRRRRMAGVPKYV